MRKAHAKQSLSFLILMTAIKDYGEFIPQSIIDLCELKIKYKQERLASDLPYTSPEQWLSYKDYYKIRGKDYALGDSNYHPQEIESIIAYIERPYQKASSMADWNKLQCKCESNTELYKKGKEIKCVECITGVKK